MAIFGILTVLPYRSIIIRLIIISVKWEIHNQVPCRAWFSSIGKFRINTDRSIVEVRPSHLLLFVTISRDQMFSGLRALGKKRGHEW